MSNIRYELTEENQDNFNPKLLYVSVSKYENDWTSTPHYHPYTEIIFVTGGHGWFVLDGKEYEIKRGTLAIANPNIMHTERSDTNKPLEYIIVGVDNVAFNFIRNDDLAEDNPAENEIIFSFSQNYEKTYYYLSEIIRELSEKAPNYKAMTNHIVNILLLFIMRHAKLRASMFQHGIFMNKECAFVKQYIDEHYADDITLDYLSGKTFVNKYHLVHMFTKQFGMPPIAYLMEKRIREAKYLLKNTRMSITDISRATGFSSSSFFAKRFKTSVKMSPIAYRYSEQSD